MRRTGGARLAAAAAAAAVPLSVSLTPGVASADPGNATAAAAMTDLRVRTASGLTSSVEASLASVTAPPDDSSTAATLGAEIAGVGRVVIVRAAAVSSVARSRAAQSQGEVELTDVAVHVPGLAGATALFTANTLGAIATCPTDRDRATRAIVQHPATVTVAGTTVALDANGAATADVVVGGVAAGKVRLDLDTRETTTGSAAATALVLDVDATVSGVRTTGTITLARATCERPAVTAPDEPTATAISPARGPTAGGSTIVVTGTDFVPGETTVTIGRVRVPAGAVTVAPGGTSLTFKSPPAAAAGPVDVTVTTPGGRTARPLTFTYVAPAISAVTPAAGPTTGGTRITLEGSGFVPGAIVTVGGGAASGVRVSPDGTSLTATTPAGRPGAADVAVTLPGADAALPSGFTYNAPAAPTVQSISPARGPVAGGTQVTITGSGFVPGATRVAFGGTTVPPAAVAVAAGGASLRVRTPAAAAAGPVDVTVTTPLGTASLRPLVFTYVAPAAAATAVTPGKATTPGGIGGGQRALATTASPTGTPRAAGTPSGSTRATTASAQAQAAPVAVSLAPSKGPTTGDTTVTVDGSDFVPGRTTVTIGGVVIPADEVTVTPDGTLLAFLTPPNTAGEATVTVTTPAGMSDPLTFTYVAAAAAPEPGAGPSGDGGESGDPGTDAGSGAGSGDDPGPAELASTGAETGIVALLGLLLLGAGIVLVRRQEA